MALEHRPYRDGSDLDAMKRLLVDGRRVSPHSGYMHVGDIDWSLFGPHGLPLSALVHLWEDGYALAAWVLLSRAGFDYQVAPARRGSDIEREIVAWGQGATFAWQKMQGVALSCVVEPFVDDRHRVALLEGLGYAATGLGSVQFARRLDAAIPEPALPEGWEVRGLRESDIESRAAAQFEAFAPGSKTTPATWRHLMTNAPGYDADLDNVVVAPDGTVAAAALVWLDAENRVGEFEPVGTRPAFQRRGLARAALLRGLHIMRGRGMTTAIVQTNADNAPAIAAYQSVGFEMVNRRVEYALTPGTT